MNAESDNVFFDLDGVRLGKSQAVVVSQIEDCLRRLDAPYVDQPGTARLSPSGDVRLTLWHRRDSAVTLAIIISPDDEVAVVCPSLHPGFLLRFNSAWEPDEALGDLSDAYSVIRALIEGRVVSEVWWASDEGAAKSRDFLIQSDGSDQELYRQYHAELLFSTLRRRCERRRVSFVESDGLTVTSCREAGMVSLLGRLGRRVHRWVK